MELSQILNTDAAHDPNACTIIIYIYTDLETLKQMGSNF